MNAGKVIEFLEGEQTSAEGVAQSSKGRASKERVAGLDRRIDALYRRRGNSWGKYWETTPAEREKN